MLVGRAWIAVEDPQQPDWPSAPVIPRESLLSYLSPRLARPPDPPFQGLRTHLSLESDPALGPGVLRRSHMGERAENFRQEGGSPVSGSELGGGGVE